MANKDFTVYYPLFNGKIYIATPCSFNGMTKGGFNNPEHTLNFLKKCFINKEDCEAECNRFNEILARIDEAADTYIGHEKEVDEGLTTSMHRQGFKDGAWWVFKNYIQRV